VQIDLVDQSQLEQLAADGGREHLEVLAVGRRQPDLPSMAWSQPFRPPRMAPIVAMYSLCRPGRTETPVIQSIP
jgi:hypothetical protein